MTGKVVFLSAALCVSFGAYSAPTTTTLSTIPTKASTAASSTLAQPPRLSFDLPLTYNSKVKWWIQNFQGGGRKWFRTWLERSNAYLPNMQTMMAQKGLPQDLAYIAMIESGFSAHATSHMEAVGYWQFITPTANRYGLTTSWWLDERRDYVKSTTAATKYLEDLYRLFKNWYLTASAYNMGETRLRKLIERYYSSSTTLR